MRRAVLLLSMFVTACAAQGPFPSLAPRAAERGLAGGSAPAPCPDEEAVQEQLAAAPAPVPSDAALRARVAALLVEARQGQAAFSEILPRASQSAARAGAAGSEPWIAAQQEISRLAAARARTSDALAELDSLSIGRSAAGALNQEDYQAIDAAEGEVRALAEQQESELVRLTGLVGEP